MFARSYGQTPGINPNQGPRSVEGLGGQFGGFGGGLGFNGGPSQNDRRPQGSFGAPANDRGGFGFNGAPAPTEQPQTAGTPQQSDWAAIDMQRNMLANAPNQQFPAPPQPMTATRPQFQAQRPNQNRYDKFAEAMMNARGGRRGGMGKPMGPRPGMSPPLIPGGGQSMGGQMQAKPAMQPMQPGAPILTNGPGIY